MDPQEAEQTLQEMFGPLLGKRNTPTEDAAKTNPSERPNKTGKQNDGGKGRGHNRPPRAPFRGAGRNAQQPQGQSPAVKQGGTQTGDPSLDSSAGGHRHSSPKHGLDMVAYVSQNHQSSQASSRPASTGASRWY